MSLSRIAVEVLLLGGAPNPILDITDPSVIAKVCDKTLQQSVAPACRVIGFTGFKASCVDGDHLIRGVTEVDALLFAQPDFIALGAAVKDHVKTEAKLIADRSCKHAVAEDSNTTTVSSKQCDTTGGSTPIRGPDDASKVHYDVAADDGGCFKAKQGDNNCYNYGNDVVTNTFAQPGRGSGVCSHHDRPCVPNTCDDVRKAAEHDGLKWVGTTLPTSLPANGHYISLHIWPSSNFHWLRMDADLKWSHKPGGSPVRNVDNNGNLITDPGKCDVSPWSTHCGYMLTVPSNVTLY